MIIGYYKPYHQTDSAIFLQHCFVHLQGMQSSGISLIVTAHKHGVFSEAISGENNSFLKTVWFEYSHKGFNGGSFYRLCCIYPKIILTKYSKYAL